MSTLLEKASLVLIPSGYKEDVVYSQIPTSGAGDLSFTRASNGTRINSAGLVEVCPWNLVEQSSTFNVSPWSNSGVTLTSGVTDFNGTNNAFRFQCGSGTNYLFNVISSNVGQQYTHSFYARAVSGTQNIRIDDAYQGGGNTATLTTEWQRVSMTFVASGSNIGIQIWNNNAFSVDIYICFAQTNIGSTAKPYFPTTDRLNVPRLTYQNGGGGCPSLLLEKQSTNLILQSEAFNNASWVQFTTGGGSVNVIANTAISPDGTQNADEIQLTRSALTNDALLFQQQNVGNATYSRTIYLKAARSQDVGKKIDLWSYSGSAVLNPISATLTADWQRFDAGTSTGALVEILSFGYLSSSTFPTTSGTDVRFYAWGAQGEASSYPTSYIPTTSSSATRVADACYKTGISALFGTNQGTFFIDFVYYGSEQFCYIFDVTDSSNVNRFLMYDSNGSGLFYFYDNGYTVIDAYQLTKGQRYKIGVKYNSSGTIWYVNGVLKGTGTVSFAHQMSQLYLGIRYSITDNTGMTVNESIVFPTALSGTELIALTTI